MKRLILICLCLAFSSLAFSADYRAQLSGKRLFMKDAYCAGISLGKVAGLYAEMDCGIMPGRDSGPPDLSQVPRQPNVPAQLRWLSGDTFYIIHPNTIFIDDQEVELLPLIFLYKVEALKGDSVTLTSVWTGWNKLENDRQEYWIRPDQKQFINDKYQP